MRISVHQIQLFGDLILIALFILLCIDSSIYMICQLRSSWICRISKYRSILVNRDQSVVLYWKSASELNAVSVSERNTIALRDLWAAFINCVGDISYRFLVSFFSIYHFFVGMTVKLIQMYWSWKVLRVKRFLFDLPSTTYFLLYVQILYSGLL